MSTGAAARVPRWLDLASLGVLFAALLGWTWRSWPDPLIDFWRNLYIPWRVSEGALLYQDVTDWYGPLPSLVVGAAFRVFGPGLDALLVLNGAVAVGCGLALHAALLRVGDRLSAWAGAAVFVLVFCFGQYSVLGNYNYLTPYVSQATWGFFGVLLTLAGALAAGDVREPGAARTARLGELAQGAGLAIAWLCKAETLLAALVVLVGAAALRRTAPRRESALGFALVAAPVLGWLVAQGGLRAGLEAFNHALTFPLSERARATLAEVPIFTADLGVDAPADNLASHLGRGLVLLGALAVTAVLPRLARAAPRATPAVALGLATVLVVWPDPLQLGRALLVPALLAAGLAWSAALRGQPQRRALALLALAALAMLPRMALNVRVYHYGFTMAVLAAALAVHLLTFEAPRWLEKNPPAWVRLGAVALVLALGARLTVHSLEMAGAKHLTVGEGRDTIRAFGPEAQRNGALVSAMLEAVARHAPGARTLLAFPDSAAVSYLSRRPSPIAEFEFNPVSLGFAGEANIIAKLDAHPPDAVLLCSYDLRSHGTQFFGGTRASGQALATWVKQRYRVVASGPPGPLSVTGHAWDLLVPRDEAAGKDAPP